MNIPPRLMFERRPKSEAIWAERAADNVYLRDKSSDWDYWGGDRDYNFDVVEPNAVTEWLASIAGLDVERGHIIDAGTFEGHTLSDIARISGFRKATGVGVLTPSAVNTQIEHLSGDLQNSDVYKTLDAADLIVSRMAFCHMYDRLAAFELLANTLNPGGHMLIQMPDPDTEYGLPKDVFTRIVELSGAHMLGCSGSWPSQVDIHIRRENDEPIRLPLDYGGRMYKVVA